MSLHKNKYCPTPPKNFPKKQSPPPPPTTVGGYIPMACVKSQKLDDSNEEVNWEYLLVFLHSLFKLRIDSLCGCAFLESLFFLDFR